MMMQKTSKKSSKTSLESEKEHFSRTVLLFFDLAAILLSFFTANYIRYRDIWQTEFPMDGRIPLLLLLFFYSVIYLIKSSTKEFYQRGPWEEMIIVLKRNILLMCSLLIAFFVMKVTSEFSRLVFGYIAICNVAFMYTFRMICKLYLIHVYNKSRSSKRLVVFTLSSYVDEVLENMKSNNLWAYNLQGFILIDEPDSIVGTEIQGIPVIGNVNNMYQCVTEGVVDEIFIHVPYSSGTHISEVIEKYEDMGVVVDLNIRVFDLNLRHRHKELKEFGNYYVIDFRQTIITLKMIIVKRIMDIIGAIVGLIITGIATIFVAPALVLESKGPIFFSQTRVGQNGRPFKIYKFRSMYMDAEERKKELMAQNKMNGLMFKMDNDPRITKVGKFIRKTSIDELPQFWNVLKGDMSLVGTRPPTMDEFVKYKSKYKRRLSIKPSITGMWQASGRSDITDFDEVLALDLEYIDNWSIGLDIKLLFKTVFVAVFGKGAE